MRFLFVLLVTIFLASCASTRGAPEIRKNENDGFGYLIDGCQNVSRNTPPLHYVTDFYLSTKWSSLSEGAQNGLQEGLAIQEEDGAKDRFTKRAAAVVLARTMGFDRSLPPKEIFCMHYDAPLEEVYLTLEGILPILQNPISDGIFEEGAYKTEPYEREQERFKVKWSDQYAIFVESIGENSTEVSVYRDLSISRQGYPYVRSISNGGNEAWILLMILEKL